MDFNNRKSYTTEDDSNLAKPRANLAEYFFPSYDPPRIELIKNGVNASSPVVSDGRESLSINGKPLKGKTFD